VIGLQDRHAALRTIELEVLRRLDGILQGDYEGFIPGHGTELGEARVYEPGDDVRRIDWNLTARTNQPHIRDAVADRELETTLVVDLSGSMSFGTALHEKKDLAVAAAGAIGLLASRGGNRIGAILLEGDRQTRYPARSGRRHLQGVLMRMLDSGRELGAADLYAGLRQADRVARRRGLVVVISDFLDATEWQQPLAVLSRRHDVICMEVLDPRELELPAVGSLTLVDTETGVKRWVNTRSEPLRHRYRIAAHEQRLGIGQLIRAAGADHVVLRTDRDWVADLVRHIARRRRGGTTGRRP
jgi:uncharacterized protein (DUF58 family)